jgi:hypothetical protein
LLSQQSAVRRKARTGLRADRHEQPTRTTSTRRTIRRIPALSIAIVKLERDLSTAAESHWKVDHTLLYRCWHVMTAANVPTYTTACEPTGKHMRSSSA